MQQEHALKLEENLRKLFLSFHLWIPRMKLRSTDLVASALSAARDDRKILVKVKQKWLILAHSSCSYLKWNEMEI